MKFIYLAALMLSVVEAECCGGFGYELIMDALQNVQSNIQALEQALEQALTDVSKKVESVITEQSKLSEKIQKSEQTLESSLKSVNTKVDRLIGDQRLSTVSTNVGSIITTATKIEEMLNRITDLSRCPSNINNGIYLLQPPNSSPFQVFCEDGWIVIQRRNNGEVDFNRNWTEYRNGFGDLRNDHWLGLEKMHQITRGGSYELKVILRSFGGVEKTAIYSGFEIGSENQQYRLDFKEFSSGDAGHSLIGPKGMKFSTPDRDNDAWTSGNCAEKYKGGWWFYNCGNSNLNGPHRREGYGIYWGYFSYSLDKARMLMRQLN